jgi:glycerol-3-phosphate dehydrogenase
MPITMVSGKSLVLITIRSVDPDLNTRMGHFIADHLSANRERRRHSRSLLRRLRDALTPDLRYDVDGACFRYETGDFRLEGDAYINV